MWIVAEKGLVLHERLDCLLRPTARDKILTYLKNFSGLENGKIFYDSVMYYRNSFIPSAVWM